MLVLTRKKNEQIRIGNNVTITIVRTQGNAVRLGIQAPDDVPILRGELVFDLMAEEGASADESSSVDAGGQAMRRPSVSASPRRANGHWPTRPAVATSSAQQSPKDLGASAASRPLQVGVNNGRNRGVTKSSSR